MMKKITAGLGVLAVGGITFGAVACGSTGSVAVPSTPVAQAPAQAPASSGNWSDWATSALPVLTSIATDAQQAATDASDSDASATEADGQKLVNDANQAAAIPAPPGDAKDWNAMISNLRTGGQDTAAGNFSAAEPYIDNAGTDITNFTTYLNNQGVSTS